MNMNVLHFLLLLQLLQWTLGTNPPIIDLIGSANKHSSVKPNETREGPIIDNYPSDVTIFRDVDRQISTLTFLCSHVKPIQWIFECPHLINDDQLSIIKWVDSSNNGNSTNLKYFSKMIVKLNSGARTPDKPSNFSCQDYEDQEISSSILFSPYDTIDVSESFRFYKQNKSVGVECTNDSTKSSKCLVHILFDKITRRFACENNMTRKIIDCNQRLDYCISNKNQDMSNNTCVRETKGTNDKHTQSIKGYGRSILLQCSSFKIINTAYETGAELDYLNVPIFSTMVVSILYNFQSFQINIDTSFEGITKEILREGQNNGFFNISILTQPKLNGTYFTGDKITFKCSALASLFANGFQWITVQNNLSTIYYPQYIDNDNLTISANEIISEEKVFEMRPGFNNFTCRALMSIYEAKWVDVSVNVSASPTQLSVISNFNFSEDGDKMRFVCIIRGYQTTTMIELITPDNRPSEEEIGETISLNCTEKQKNSPHRLDLKAIRRDKGGSERRHFMASIPTRSVADYLYATCTTKIEHEIITTSWISIMCNDSYNEDPKTDNHTFMIVAICAIVILLIAIIWIVIVKWKSTSSFSEGEYIAFYKGAQGGTGHNLIPNDPSQTAILLAYDKRYEIAREKIQLNGVVLGSGQFGIVVQGTLNGVLVAIKTIRQKTDISYFKALLAELKILIYLGHHPHIVNLIGACTGKLRKMEVLLVIDYCANGNLVKFLRSSRPHFVNLYEEAYYGGDGNEGGRIYENSQYLSTKDLLRFSFQVADAMAFIAEKNILHGDLAARNVLVTQELHVKLCDFGLAKQLSNYAIYVQKQECPLPLRWMAIESLRDMEFSIESDAWSFGVLLWEIFSLAEIPYPGLDWGFNSWRMLEDGHRMDKPQYSNNNTFKLMLKCWNIKANERPKFHDIAESLEKERDSLREACQR